MNDVNLPTLKDDPERSRLESLLRLFDQDRDRAGEKYEHLRRRLIKFFEWNSCFPAEDLADEAFQRLEQRIGQVEIHDVVGFAWGVAKNLRLEARRRNSRTVSIADLPLNQDPLPDQRDHEKDLHEKMQQERRFKCLQMCLQRMHEPDRQLFLAYHNVQGEGLGYRQGLARRLSITLGALRVRVNRMRDQLEKCARKCFSARRVNPGRTT
jgi:RNA polymerase sigma factor (sigma-70 family)